jgi:hypothetical protein
LATDDLLRRQLLEAAAEARRREAAALEEAQRYSHVAAQLESQAAALEDGPLTSKAVLHKGEKQSTVNDKKMLTADHRMAIAASAKPRGRVSKDPLHLYLRERKWSQNRLAAALGVDKSLISRYRRRKSPIAIPRDRAEEIERLTGWPATDWPKIS